MNPVSSHYLVPPYTFKNYQTFKELYRFYMHKIKVRYQIKRNLKNTDNARKKTFFFIYFYFLEANYFTVL